MMKKIIRFSIILFIMFFSFKAQAYALRIEPSVPKMVDEGNLEQTKTMLVNKEFEVIERPNVEYRARGLRNPFEQPITDSEPSDGSLRPQRESLPSLTVQGVIWGGSFPQAIVNNKVIKVGDVLEGVDIVAIDKEGVTVSYAGVEYKLTTLPAMGQQVISGK